jgi:hypothetical protein
VSPQSVNGFNDGEWVKVTGVIQFLKLPGQDRYTPVLQLPDITDVERTEVSNEYEF